MFVWSGEMWPNYLYKTDYKSCIKIAGISILPPLVTEERKKELLEDKDKAIAIEKKLKAKRQSIDSGVMTSSYTDIFKNGELPVVETLPAQILSFPNQTEGSNSQTDTESISGDSFLKTALEDQEFREFFYSTADRIFKDIRCSEAVTKENNTEHLVCEKEIVDNGVCNATEIKRPSDSLDLSICNNLILISSVNNLPSEESTKGVSNKEIPSVTEIPPTPPRMVRRNSYTLESPSPVLLEHMAKENEKTQEDQVKWQPISDRKREHTGFKTFSHASKPRKTWNKQPSPEFKLMRMNSCPPSPKYNQETTEEIKPVPLRRTNTFTKSRPKSEVICSNFSLPTSSRTSPIHMLNSAQSTSCIQTVLKPSTSHSYPVLKHNNAASETSSTNHTLTSSHSQCDADLLSASQHYMSDSLSQVSTVVTDSVSPKPKWISHLDNSSNEHSNNDTLIDADDSVSVCSSLSLSRFLPADCNSSRPSTAEDIDSLFNQLQLQHERQMAELLEQQHKEKKWLAALKSNDNSIISRSNTAMSAPYEEALHPPMSMGNKVSCNKELFPNNILKSSGQIKTFSTDNKRAAAVKITAHAKGYLTRRLLKTERVLRCKEMIQESLRYALSLQTEQRTLDRSEIEFHDRLAHQLTWSLNELQAIVSAPVVERMAIIAADRERLKRPPSRPVSALSTATRKSILRRQASLNNVEGSPQEVRARTSSLCSTRSESAFKSNGPGKSSKVQSRRSVSVNENNNRQKNLPQR